MGEIISQSDDVFAKDYDNVIFAQKNPVRVAIRRGDDKVITKKDINKLKNLSHVESVEKYDGINDINYYYQKGKDYDLDYNDMRYYQGKQICSVSFLKQDHFMKSVSSIAGEKLKQGTLAEALNEIVVSRDCGMKMGQKIKIYFTCDNAWGAGQFFEREFEVVGVAKHSSSQIYFSNAFAKMLDATVAGYRMKLNYKYDMRKGGFIYKDQFIPLINENLPGTKSDDYPVKQNFILAEKDGIKPEDGKSDLIGEAVTSLFYRQERGGDSEDTNGADLIQSGDQVAFLQVNDINENMSGRFLEVSKESFYYFYDSDSKQMSLFLDSYANMDSVLAKVQKLGYMGISTYRISTGDYDDEKVNNRTTRLIVAVGILLFLALLETVLVSIIMGMQSDYYLILHALGMKRKQLRQVCFVEMFLYFATSVIVVLSLTFLGMWILRTMDLVGKEGIASYVNNILYYFKWQWIVGYILYNFLLQICATKVFVRRMRGGIRL